MKKATREAYGTALAEIAKYNDRIVALDADLSNSTKSADFKKEYPDRFFNAGIAEANMIGMAAGMAASGLIPFASTFAMFAAGRAFEQIRNSVAYPRGVRQFRQLVLQHLSDGFPIPGPSEFAPNVSQYFAAFRPFWPHGYQNCARCHLSLIYAGK